MDFELSEDQRAIAEMADGLFVDHCHDDYMRQWDVSGEPMMAPLWALCIETGLQALARCALLCNDAQLHRDEAGGWTLAGDPTEGALLTLALKAGLNLAEAGERTPRIDVIPFESEHRYMATLHHDHAGHLFAQIKGAPERVLGLCVKDSNGPLDDAAWVVQRILD